MARNRETEIRDPIVAPNHARALPIRNCKAWRRQTIFNWSRNLKPSLGQYHEQTQPILMKNPAQLDHPRSGNASIRAHFRRRVLLLLVLTAGGFISFTATENSVRAQAQTTASAKGKASAPSQLDLGILFGVNDGGDADDWSPGDGVCETDLGNNICTLRAAIEEVNARNTGEDGIGIQVPVVTLRRALPVITVQMIITGSGPDLTTVERSSGLTPLFGIFSLSVAQGAVSFSGLTITNGYGGNYTSGDGAVIMLTSASPT